VTQGAPRQAKIGIGQFFATPIAQIELPDMDALNAELAELFLAREGEADKFRNPHRYTTQFGELFESRFDLFHWPDPPVQRLASIIHHVLTNFVREINRYGEEDMQRLTFHYHSWFHVTRRGGYQTLHDHAMASWSGIYYVHPGDSLPGHPESGVVRFYDPRGFSPMYIDGANRQLDPRFAFAALPVIPQAGRMLLFPSWLAHEILPYQGEKERIVVAFNSWAEERR